MENVPDPPEGDKPVAPTATLVPDERPVSEGRLEPGLGAVVHVRGAKGQATLAKLEETHGRLPLTVVARSGDEEFIVVGNHAGYFRPTELGDGVRILGDEESLAFDDETTFRLTVAPDRVTWRDGVPEIADVEDEVLWRWHAEGLFDAEWNDDGTEVRWDLAPMIRWDELPHPPAWIVRAAAGRDPELAEDECHTGAERERVLAFWAGLYRERGFDDDFILSRLTAKNRNTCMPPLEDNTVVEIASPGSTPDADATTDEPSLRCIKGPNETPTKITATFEVIREESSVGVVTVSSASLDKAARSYAKILGVGPEEYPRLEAELSRALSDARRQRGNEPKVGSRTMTAIAGFYVAETFKPAFRRGKELWMEQLGDTMTASELRGHQSSELEERLRDASDAPDKITAAVIARALGTVFGNLLRGLPEEIGDTGLGTESRAAAAFRARVQEALTSLAFQTTQGSERVRESLLQRAIDTTPQRESWGEIQHGFTCWARKPEDHLEIALTVPVFKQGPRPVRLPGVELNADFLALAERYGIGERDKHERLVLDAKLVRSLEKLVEPRTPTKEDEE